MRCRRCDTELAPRRAQEWLCPYCGTDAGAGIPFQSKVKKGISPIAATAVFAVLFLGIGLGVVLYKRHHYHYAAYTPYDIAKAPQGRWVGVSRKGVVGSLKAFDPVANYGWARGLATGWASDARLERITADHIGRDGAFPDLHLTKYHRDWDVSYVFFSPSLLERSKEQAKTSEHPVANSIAIWVHDGRTLAMLQYATQEFPESAPEARVSCSIADVMREAKEPPRPARERPFYDLVLRYYDQHWVWQVDTKTNVDAESCKQPPRDD